MPDVIDRYQDFRTRRFLRNEEKFQHWLPGWRIQKRRRALVVTLCATFACMIVVAAICLVNMLGAVLWLPVVVVFLPVWTTLQVVSGRQSDAPRDALDERELRQRDSARSIGLTVTQCLAMVPAFALIVAGSSDGAITFPTYSAGMFVLTALIIGACTPAMILAWTRTDPEPDDYLTEAA
ncbi:hypothetical protein [Tomitella biformata]|uniref:hypothetical protein n=1 Tax=Tomitella biformata TaxID=630403 RepID=UPI000466BA86|nr:hypothetical protein [Tomitella biformata]